MEDDIKSELTGNFEKVVCGLLMTAPYYDAYELRNAIKVSESFVSNIVDQTTALINPSRRF